MDDTLACSDDAPHLEAHTNAFVALGEAHDLIDATDKAETLVNSTIFAGKAVSHRAISHPQDNYIATVIYIITLLTTVNARTVASPYYG